MVSDPRTKLGFPQHNTQCIVTRERRDIIYSLQVLTTRSSDIIQVNHVIIHDMAERRHVGGHYLISESFYNT